MLPRGVRRRPGREQDEERPQPLASRADRRPGVLGEHRPVPTRELCEAPFDLRQELGHPRPGGLDDRADRCGGGGHDRGFGSLRPVAMERTLRILEQERLVVRETGPLPCDAAGMSLSAS